MCSWSWSKELRELQNDYPLAPDKIEIKKDMLSVYQSMIFDLCNFPIGKKCYKTSAWIFW